MGVVVCVHPTSCGVAVCAQCAPSLLEACAGCPPDVLVKWSRLVHIKARDAFWSERGVRSSLNMLSNYWHVSLFLCRDFSFENGIKYQEL